MSSTDNPYRPPSAAVADIPAGTPDTAFGLPAATLDAGRGAAWISEGWTLFKAAPVMWIVAMVILVGVQMALGLLPVVGGILGMLAGPLFMAGMLAFSHGIARGEEADLGKLFLGFREKTGPLLAIAVLYFLVFLGLMVVFAVAAFFMLGGVAAFAGGNPDQVLESLLAGAGVMGLLLLFLAFLGVMVLVLAAYWFAPGLVLYTGLGAGDAMKASFRACLRNWLPFLVYGVLSVVVLLGGAMLLIVGMVLLSLPILMASYYASFRDLFGQQA